MSPHEVGVAVLKVDTRHRVHFIRVGITYGGQESERRLLEYIATDAADESIARMVVSLHHRIEQADVVVLYSSRHFSGKLNGGNLPFTA